MKTIAFVADISAPRIGAAFLMSITSLTLVSSPSYAACDPPEHEPPSCEPPAPLYPALGFQGDTGPRLRVRKSVFELTPYEIERLKYAFAEFRKLSIDDYLDPRGWQQQANVHCWACGRTVADGLGMEIHGGWWFFPWHRAYLYFVEKILGELIGDPSFALPYWDWDTEGRNRIPEVYYTPGDESNPLFNATRLTDVASCVSPMADFKLDKINALLDLDDWEDFMGKRRVGLGPVDPRNMPEESGQLESGIHNRIHGWIPQKADERFCGNQDMGYFSTSGQDPIFFAHHANIDRMWEVWRTWKMQNLGGLPRELPPDDEWHQYPFKFYDQNQEWVEISVDQLLDTVGSLGYGYSPPTPDVVPYKCPAESPALAMAPMLASYAAPLAQPLNGPQVLTSRPQTVIAPVVAPAAFGYAGAGALPMEGPAVPRIHIDGVVMPPGGAATISVYTADPNANANSLASSQTYVGSFTIVPHHGAGHHGAGHHGVEQHGDEGAKPKNFSFVLSPEATLPQAQLMALGSQGGTVPVTLAVLPGDSLQPQKGTLGGYAAMAANESVLEYKQVYITPF